MDEALALPTEKAARIALRTQQVIAYETNVVHVADPLGGSWFVEELTDEMEAQAEEIFAEILAMGEGSMLDGLHQGHRGQLVPGPHRRVGLPPRALLQPGLAHRRRRERLHRGQRRRGPVRRERDEAKVLLALEELTTDALDPEVNLMPALINASGPTSRSAR
jgi:methylmalonyl-CoA mutase N-terminal domain/subunit